ncbi:Homeodomain-like [Trema orientale]|uniref:Homeodomain-like n=1 Tax=Trema orientale TaxID=63057 RepID=A0A2P5FH42_TREOI|nr:Homeodomain-like [Trema orientale]
MPKRDSAISTLQSTTLRRSPRLLHKSEKISEQVPLVTPRRSPRLTRQNSFAQEAEDPKSPKSITNRARSSGLSENVSKKSSKPSNGLRKCGSLSSGPKKSVILGNGFDGFSNPRRSSRISDKVNAVGYESRGFLGKVSKKVGESDVGSKKFDGFFNPRRSSRISDKVNAVGYESKGCLGKVSKKVGESDVGSKKFLRNNGVDGFKNVRRSQRLSNQQKVVNEHTEKTGKDNGCRLSSDSASKEEALDTGKGKVGVTSAENLLVKGKRLTKREAEELDGESREVEVSKKRKRDVEGNGTVQGWTKEQELALQRAYLVAKPTPHFWRKVSKLVPGKSAQDCFDKVNADHLTPPQRHPASRAKKRRSLSPIPDLQLSASKLLKPNEVKGKKPSCNKRKSHITQKNVRQLLRMHYHQNQDHDADLFSVLEPNLDLSTHAFQPSSVFSTPKHLQEKQGLLKNCNDRFSSGHKKTLSRFSGSYGMAALASPPVLKQVKNRVLHEKYIDQLHNRDAKRKAASKHAKRATLIMDDRKEIRFQKLDVIRTAKNALVSDAREAISTLRHIQANATNNSDLDDDVFRSDDDESENGT